MMIYWIDYETKLTYQRAHAATYVPPVGNNQGFGHGGGGYDGRCPAIEHIEAILRLGLICNHGHERRAINYDQAGKPFSS